MNEDAAAAAKRRRHTIERIVAAVFVLALTAGLVAFYRWNQREEERFRRERTYIPKEEKITPEILLLQEYVRIDTTAGKELAGARWLLALMQKNGVTGELIESAPGRANVYARIRGKRQGEGLLLLNHIDVVAPGDGTWSHPPFGGEIALNQLHGRGALDMKGIALTQLFAFMAVARSGRTPERDIVFLATADEEQRGTMGVVWLLEHRPDVFAGVRYALNEGGINEMYAERMTYFGIEIGMKHFLELEATAPGLESLARARAATEGHLSRRNPDRILPEVAKYFAEIAPTRQVYGPLLADIHLTVARGDFWKLPVNYRHLTQNILWMPWPQKKGDVWAAPVYLSSLPDEEPEERIAAVRRLFAEHGVALRKVHGDDKAPLSPSNTPLFRLLVAEAKREYRVAAGTLVLHRSSNDSRHLRARGIVCYGVSPYPVDSFQAESIHAGDERIRLDWFMQGVGFMQRVVGTWAFAPQ